MLKTYLLSALLLLAWPACLGQHFVFRRGETLLYFRKNGHRETAYGLGDALSFTVGRNPARISGRIQGFEGDSVLLLDAGYRVSVRRISALYVDDKTKIWFIFRYKYEKLGYLGPPWFFPSTP